MLDFDALLNGASLPEATVPICLDGRLVRAYEEVRTRVEARTSEGAGPQVGPVPLGAKGEPARDPEQDELDRLTGLVEAKSALFVVRAMSRDAFLELTARPEFKARIDLKTGEIDFRDARMRMNTATFIPGLVEASLVDPDVSVDGRWEQLRAVLTSAQMARLFAAAWDINQEDRDIPFSLSASPSPPSFERG